MRDTPSSWSKRRLGSGTRLTNPPPPMPPPISTVTFHAMAEEGSSARSFPDSTVESKESDQARISYSTGSFAETDAVNAIVVKRQKNVVKTRAQAPVAMERLPAVEAVHLTGGVDFTIGGF